MTNSPVFNVMSLEGYFEFVSLKTYKKIFFWLVLHFRNNIIFVFFQCNQVSLLCVCLMIWIISKFNSFVLCLFYEWGHFAKLSQIHYIFSFMSSERGSSNSIPPQATLLSLFRWGFLLYPSMNWTIYGVFLIFDPAN